MTRTTRRNLLIAGTAGTALALGGAALFTAVPTDAAGWLRSHGGGTHGFRHGDGARDPEHMRRHLRRGVEWMLDEVDASDEQVDAVVASFEGALADLDGMRERHHTQREAISEALAAPEVDREALESIRAEGMALAEQASSRFVTALADAAEVLTPSQREELLRAHEDFHGSHGRWFR